MKKTRLYAGLAAAVGIAVVGLKFVHKGSSSALEVNNTTSMDQVQPKRGIASLTDAKPVAVSDFSAPVPATSDAGPNADLSYFHDKMTKNPHVADYYKKLRERLPASAEGDLAAVYISEAIARENTAEFADFMRNLRAAMNANPTAMYNMMMENQSTLQSGALTYQMSLNLANSLDISSDQKANLLGQALAINIQFDENGQVDPLSSNVLTALILMKNSGITSEQAQPYIQQGLAANANDPAALSAFTDRVHAYYPDIL